MYLVQRESEKKRGGGGGGGGGDSPRRGGMDGRRCYTIRQVGCLY